jgi:hypothetical protein
LRAGILLCHCKNVNATNAVIAAQVGIEFFGLSNSRPSIENSLAPVRARCNLSSHTSCEVEGKFFNFAHEFEGWNSSAIAKATTPQTLSLPLRWESNFLAYQMRIHPLKTRSRLCVRDAICLLIPPAK